MNGYLDGRCRLAFRIRASSRFIASTPSVVLMKIALARPGTAGRQQIRDPLDGSEGVRESFRMVNRSRMPLNAKSTLCPHRPLGWVRCIVCVYQCRRVVAVPHPLLDSS